MREPEELERRNWWRARRLRYNVGLIVAGVCAFALYAGIVFTAPIENPAAPLGEMPEVTLFTTLFQGVGYLFAMLVANICYGTGALLERLLRPNDPARYRKLSFASGFWFSVALPFTIPLLVAIKAAGLW
jgi:hypothetical protein